jgi:hypothetical protein
VVAHAPPALNKRWEQPANDELMLAADRQEASMCMFVRWARLRARRDWLAIAAVCFVPALLLSNSSLTASAQEMMRDRPMHRQHDGGGGSRGFGTGIGIGIGIGSAVIEQLQRQQAQDPRDVPAQSNVKKPRKKKDGSNTKATKKKKKQDGSGVAKKKDDPNSSSKKKDDPVLSKNPPLEPPAQGKPPSLVVYPVPGFPSAPDSDECKELWEAVVRYQKIVASDMNKLADVEKELEDRRRERDMNRALSKSAKGRIQKTYYEQLAKNADEHIEALDRQNGRLKKLIDEEKELLAKWYAAYQRCVAKNRNCEKKITDTPTSPPQHPPAAPPVDTPAPPVPPAKVVTTPEPPLTPVSTPQQQERKICGPDITELVLALLRKMKRQFEDKPDQQGLA